MQLRKTRVLRTFIQICKFAFRIKSRFVIIENLNDCLIIMGLLQMLLNEKALVIKG